MIWSRKQPSSAVAARWPLTKSLASFGSDPWTIEDSFQGLLCTGATGSGKSSGPAAFFSKKLLSAGYGGIVLCHKREEKDIWIKRMKDAGRAADIQVFGLGEPHRFNFLDFESRQESSGLDQIDNLGNMLLNIASVRRTSPVGNEATWWLPQKKALIRNCLSALLLAGDPLTIRAINSLLQSAPRTVGETENSEWQRGSYLASTLLRAECRNPNHPELKEVRDYWFRIRAAIPDKTRVITDAEYMGMVSGPLSRGAMSELFSTETNLTPKDCFEGKVIIIDLPVTIHEEAGQYAALIWLVSFMRATQRRSYNPPHDRPIFIFADEAQSFSSDHDADYFATSRSLGVCNIRLTQNLPGFIRSYGGGEQAKLAVNQTLGNLCTKVFLRNDDAATNEWASKIIAKQPTYRRSMSSGSNGGAMNTSVAEATELCCPEETFLGLRNGGKKNKYEVEAVCFQAGRAFQKNRRWITAGFIQDR